MESKRWITITLILLLFGSNLLSGGAPPSWAADPGGFAREGGPAAPQIRIALRDGLLSLDLRDAEIGDVLRAIAERTGIALAIGEGVAGKVTLALEGVSLEEALRQLCANRAILYEYDPEGRIGRIVGAAAFASALGPSAALPRETAAGSAPTPVNGTGGMPEPDPFTGGQQNGEIGLPQGKHLARTGGEGPLDSRGRLLFKPGELLVRFRTETTEEQRSALHLSLGSVVLKSLSAQKIDRVRLREGLSEREGVARYLASEIVAVAERHALRYPLLAPNDPYYSQQWNMERIGMPVAWEMTKGKAEVVIGVIDTGVDTRHPDMAANMLPGRDLAGAVGIDETDADGDPMDTLGHGTHVAGIIAAVGNNGIGIAGVGWRLRILPLKVLADDRATIRDLDYGVMETFDIIAAIDYAIAAKVRIVNCSFGGEPPPPPPVPVDPDSPDYEAYLADYQAYQQESQDFQLEYEAFDRLRQAGILAVCAAGNDGNNNDTSPMAIYPASHDLDNIISVAASNSSLPDGLWGSNYGKKSVDLMAPGYLIRSTWPCPAMGTCDSYQAQSGTSMAAPHVAGVAGLILSRNPRLGYARVKSIILESVDPIAAVTEKLASGGRLNAAAALARTPLPGDLTGDGRIGLDDVILALRLLSGLGAADFVRPAADVDGDGDSRVGIIEAIYGLQALSGLRE